MFFGLITSSITSETSDVLLDATANFAVTIQQQFEMLVGDPAPAELAKKTIDYATAKTAYFYALRAKVSELIDIATIKETRPPEVDIFVAAFVVAGEEREKVEKAVAPLFFNSLPLVCRSSPLPRPIVKPLWRKPLVSRRAPLLREGATTVGRRCIVFSRKKEVDRRTGESTAGYIYTHLP